MDQSLKALLQNVEIEVNSRCNRRCSYCPVSLNPAPSVPRLMSDELFERILSELASLDYDGRISYHFYGEPLLRKDLEKLIARSHAVLPKAHQILFTNGDYMTDERYQSLIAAGVEYIVITSHDGKPHPQRPRQIVQYSNDLELTNRGGTMQEMRKASENEQHKPCYAPSELMVITVEGDILACYEDSQRTHPFGNVMKNTLKEIWDNPRYSALRETLARGDRLNGMSVCRECTNVAHTTPDRSAHSEPFWAKLNLDW